MMLKQLRSCHGMHRPWSSASIQKRKTDHLLQTVLYSSSSPANSSSSSSFVASNSATSSIQKAPSAGNQVTFLEKLQGVPNTPPNPPVSWTNAATASVAAFVGLGGLSSIHYFGLGSDMTLVLAPFGATSCLLFGAPAAPVSQPRQVIGGHAISCFVGLLAKDLIATPMDTPVLAIPIAVSLSLFCMQTTNTFHPPSGGTALMVLLGSAKISELGWMVLCPTIVGSTFLVGSAAILNNLLPNRRYPSRWF